MSDPSDNIIDLTSPVPFGLVKHCNFSDDVIEIDDNTDDSICEVIVETNQTITAPNKASNKLTKKSRAKSLEPKMLEVQSPEKKGIKIECPICCEQLGKKPASSTKCGHVFCLECIQRSLKHDKRCPQCRRALKGATAFHPLYLPIQT